MLPWLPLYSTIVRILHALIHSSSTGRSSCVRSSGVCVYVYDVHPMGRLMWPNLEVTFFVSFSTGLLQCAASVLGATFAGYATSSLSLVTCIMTLTFIVVAYAWQCYRLVIFLKYHNDDCWQPAEAPAAKDGACKYACTRVHMHAGAGAASRGTQSRRR